MKKNRHYLAFDIGASSGRGMLGKFDGNRLSLETIGRFENGAVRIGDHLHWNILGIWQGIKDILCHAALAETQTIDAIGVDTWAVDFGLLDHNDELLGLPYCYRDPAAIPLVKKLSAFIPDEELFQISGLQFMSFNTLYRLWAMRLANSPLLDAAHTLLLIPDLLNFWMCGVKVSEYTNASTTQFMNCRTHHWEPSLLERLDIPTRFLTEIIQPGQTVGRLTAAIQAETGLGTVPVIAVGSHDTASAVAAVPALCEDFCYLSSGTWGLFGVEVPQPFLNQKVLQYNFANEGGVCNTIRLLRNIVNLWLLQECRRVWAKAGQAHTWDELTAMAEAAPAFSAFIDPDHPDLFLPQHIPQAIQQLCQDSAQPIPQSKGEILRLCQESLAFKYRYTLEKVSSITGKRPTALHIVGGGAQNRLLCQFAADALNLPVHAGPVEATALGNILMQMIALGDIASLAEGRELLHRSFSVVTYLPQNPSQWEEQYRRFLLLTGLPPIN